MAMHEVSSVATGMSDKLKFADVLAAQTSVLIRLIRAGLDVREANLDDRLLLDRIEDTITAYREAKA